MTGLSRLVCRLVPALLILSAPASSTLAHSLEALEEKLAAKETYVQIVDRPAPEFMLTSGPEEPSATRQIAEKYGLKFTLGEDGYQMHGVVTHLIDKSGNLRARYHGLKFNPTNLIVHITALTNDYH